MISKVRWRFAWRDLWLHRSRTVLVILSIAIGVFAFGAILGSGNTLRLDLPARYLEVEPASVILHTSLFGDGIADAMRRGPDVAAAEGRRTEVLQFRNGLGEWHDLRLFALEDYENVQVNKIRPFRGAWPPPERAVLIERNSVGIIGANIGGELVLETDDGKQRRLPVVGLVHDMIQPPAQITGVPYAYVSRDTLVWLGLTRDFNELHLIARGDRYDSDYLAIVAQDAADKMERNGRIVFWTEVPAPGEHFVMEFLPTILLILVVLGFLALILSGFLVINVITAILTQQTRQIGVMKAIGARPRQIMVLYLRMVAVFGVLALLVAIPLSVLGAYYFSSFVAAQLNFDVDALRLSPPVLIMEILIGLLAPMLAAIYPIRRSAAYTVREAISDQGLDTQAGDDSRIDRLLRLLQQRLALTRPVGLSLRNTFRRRGRLARTLVPLTLGGAIFMMVLNVRASLFRTLEDTLVNQGYDVQLRLSQPQNIERIRNEVSHIAGVGATETWNSAEGVPVYADHREGDDLLIYGVPPETQLFTPNLIGGRWLAASDRNAIIVPSSLVAAQPEVALGQLLTLRVEGQESSWRVVGVHQVFQPPIAPAILYVSQADFWSELGHHGRTNTVRMLTVTDDGATQSRVAKEVEDRLQASGIKVRRTQSAAEDRVIFSERFNIITTILMIMAFLLATVGGLGLMGTMSINVLERKREIGVLRAIGASTRAVLQIFVVEGVVIGLLSWAAGLLLSPLLSYGMGWRVGMTFAKLPLTFVYDVRAPFLWLLIVVTISALASWAPAHSAAQLKVRETLAYE